MTLETKRQQNTRNDLWNSMKANEYNESIWRQYHSFFFLKWRCKQVMLYFFYYAYFIKIKPVIVQKKNNNTYSLKLIPLDQIYHFFRPLNFAFLIYPFLILFKTPWTPWGWVESDLRTDCHFHDWINSSHWRSGSWCSSCFRRGWEWSDPLTSHSQDCRQHSSTGGMIKKRKKSAQNQSSMTSLLRWLETLWESLLKGNPSRVSASN